MKKLTKFTRYMKFTKLIVFCFLILLGIGYTDQLLHYMGFNLAELEGLALLILSVVLILYIKMAVTYYAKYEVFYDRIQTKICNFIADYVFNIHNR